MKRLMLIIPAMILLIQCNSEGKYRHSICFIKNNKQQEVYTFTYNTLDEGLQKKYDFHRTAKKANWKIITCPKQ